jgi:hypothetical protein
MTVKTAAGLFETCTTVSQGILRCSISGTHRCTGMHCIWFCAVIQEEQPDLQLRSTCTYEGTGDGLGRAPHSAGLAYSTQQLPDSDGQSEANMFHLLPSASASSRARYVKGMIAIHSSNTHVTAHCFNPACGCFITCSSSGGDISLAGALAHKAPITHQRIAAAHQAMQHSQTNTAGHCSQLLAFLPPTTGFEAV